MLTERRLEELIVEVEEYFGCGVIFGFYRKFVKEVARRAMQEESDLVTSEMLIEGHGDADQ